MSFDHVFTVRISDWEVNVISFDHLVDVVDYDHVFAVLSYLRSYGCFHELRAQKNSQELRHCTNVHRGSFSGIQRLRVSKLASSTFLLIRLGHEAEIAGTVEQLKKSLEKTAIVQYSIVVLNN